MRAAVLGSPVTHSLSPLIHNAGYAAAGLADWHYTSRECRSEQLAPFVDSLDSSWAGLSLTMPLKETVLDLAAEVTDTAQALGAANTLILRDGRRLADNTDAPGMVDALAEVGMTTAGRVSVLGAGGTARAALGAAASLGAAETVLYARRKGSHAELAPVAERLGIALRYEPWSGVTGSGDADLVISTVPQGVADQLTIDWAPQTVLFDVLYDPWPTPLATSAAAAGVRTIDGLALLLAQAVRQFEMFTGVKAPVAAMRAALHNR